MPRSLTLATHQIIPMNQFLFAAIAQYRLDIGRTLAGQRSGLLTRVVHEAPRALATCAVNAGDEITALKIPETLTTPMGNSDRP
ncbi:MAG: hypothetical protein CM15mP74_18190 [Halieaceae bacterium]|nr:MAG: hypothetical protein CM15mP74_18190 [Halieaceae bacterium]